MTANKARNAAIVQRYLARDPVADIAADHGISEARVYGLAHAAGVTREPVGGPPGGSRPRALDPVRRDEIATLIAVGWSNRRIARSVGVGARRVAVVRGGGM